MGEALRGVARGLCVAKLRRFSARRASASAGCGRSVGKRWLWSLKALAGLAARVR